MQKLKKRPHTQKTVIKGIGVDLISQSRIKAFCGTHRRRAAESMLTDCEKGVWRKSCFSFRCFSKFFSAKEASFKASGKNWLGVKGMADFEITFLSAGHFKARFLPDAEKNAGEQITGSFFECDGMTGAHAVCWQISGALR